jgi:esterase/lipase
MQKVAFKSEELTIHGTLAKPAYTHQSFPGVIIFHGMTSSEDGYIPLAAKLAEHGIAGLAISMRGHGESEGDFNSSTVAEAINDALAAYDFLAQQSGIDANRMGMVGSSVGAILAALASEQRPVRSIVFRAPAAYTEAMMRLSMAGTMTNEGRQFHEIESLSSTPAGHAIQNFSGSLLVVASEKDAIIPRVVTEGYIDIAEHSNKKRLEVIEGATHTLTEPDWKEIFSQTVVDWFKASL